MVVIVASRRMRLDQFGSLLLFAAITSILVSILRDDRELAVSWNRPPLRAVPLTDQSASAYK